MSILVHKIFRQSTFFFRISINKKLRDLGSISIQNHDLERKREILNQKELLKAAFEYDETGDIDE